MLRRGRDQVVQTLTSLVDLLFPRLCPICRTATLAASDPPCCTTCLADLQPLPEGRCSRCALPFVAGCGSSHLCADCLRKVPPYQRVIAAGLYAGSLKQALQRFKYEGAVDLDGLLADLLVSALPPLNGEEILVPVPLHPHRLRQRTYNQTLLLARAMARNLQIPLNHAMLERTLDSPSQQGLSAAQRAGNLRGAFCCNQPLAGQTLLLVDDVMTTGATVDACSRTLLEAGAGRVDVLVVARAPRH